MSDHKTSSKERLYFLLQVAAHRLRTEADGALLQSAGLTTAQIAVLNLIRAKGEDEEINQRELARTLHQNESAITAMVARLLKLGVVKRQRSKLDKRNWALELSKTGEAALAEAIPAFDNINQRLDKLFGKADSKKLAEQLRTIADEFSTDN